MLRQSHIILARIMKLMKVHAKDISSVNSINSINSGLITNYVTCASGCFCVTKVQVNQHLL